MITKLKNLDSFSKIKSLGNFSNLVFEAFTHIFKGKIRFKLVSDELYKLGAKSLTLINITAIFIGMVFAIQIAYSLEFLGAKYYLGTIIGLSIVRELGPVVTALLIAGRAGSGIAAELGTMKITEQVDAIKSFGINPNEYLVVPRILALIIMEPILTLYADFVGIAGGLIISKFQLNISGYYYLSKVTSMVSFNDIASGLSKSVFFGFFIAAIACYHGLKINMSSEEVGKATTKTVVSASITILVSDFFLTKLFLLFWGFYGKVYWNK